MSPPIIRASIYLPYPSLFNQHSSVQLSYTAWTVEVDFCFNKRLGRTAKACWADLSLQPNISFTQDLTEGIQTLSSQNSDRSGIANGFLYVPDLEPTDSCFNISKQYIPHNVTRQANLPPTDFTLIALAPWISVECTQSFLYAARSDPNRGFIFYLPNNDTARPPPSSSSMWDLQDGGSWKDNNPYPVYAIPGMFGQQLMHQLSLYSGNMTDVPFGHDVSELPGYDPRDYIRIYTAIESSNSPTLPRFWVFILVVIAVLITILGFISAGMHLTQRHRRNSLRRRVESREVNLEALGIKRLTVPQESITKLPLFIYSDEGQNSQPTSPAIKESSAITTEKEDPGSPRLNRASSSYLTSGGIEIPEEVIKVEGKTPDVVLIHRFLPYPQPTCPICLDDFVCGETEIRELPCGHIFHPECIDTFLGDNSSLCPMCKQIAWPVGDCPVTITNGMVRRERNLRRLRPRVEDVELTAGLKNTWSHLKLLSSRLKKRVSSTTTNHPGEELSTILETSHPPTSIVLPARPQSSVLEDLEMSGDSEPARAEFLAARIREIASRQTPIQDPDSERQPRKCKSISRWLRSHELIDFKAKVFFQGRFRDFNNRRV